MIDLIRLGDTTDHRGEVMTASQTMNSGEFAWLAKAMK